MDLALNEFHKSSCASIRRERLLAWDCWSNCFSAWDSFYFVLQLCSSFVVNDLVSLLFWYVIMLVNRMDLVDLGLWWSVVHPIGWLWEVRRWVEITCEVERGIMGIMGYRQHSPYNSIFLLDCCCLFNTDIFSCLYFVMQKFIQTQGMFKEALPQEKLFSCFHWLSGWFPMTTEVTFTCISSPFSSWGKNVLTCIP